MSATIGSALGDAERILLVAGIDTPRLDAKILLAHVLGCQVQGMGFRTDQTLSDEQSQRFFQLIQRRLDRQPVSQIIGERGFWTLDLTVTSDTLAPRPDSESLIEAVLEVLPDRNQPLRVVDFGTGTGCLILSVLSEYPHSFGLAVDLSPAALAVASGNALRCNLSDRVQFIQSRWASALPDQHFDLVLSNPPYIPDAEIDGLEPEVSRWEPRLALSGGPDGLECYRDLVPQIARILAPSGWAVLEVGQGQAADVAALGEQAGLKFKGTRRDLGGIERCVIFHNSK